MGLLDDSGTYSGSYTIQTDQGPITISTKDWVVQLATPRGTWTFPQVDEVDADTYRIGGRLFRATPG